MSFDCKKTLLHMLPWKGSQPLTRVASNKLASTNAFLYTVHVATF